MNKIKGRVGYDQFSPWEESFINLVNNFSPSHSGKNKNRPQKKQYLTIDTCRGNKHLGKIVPMRAQFGRTILNTSKINLRSGEEGLESVLVQQRASRYMGPRITFYSKMNPKCSNDRLHSNERFPSHSFRSSYDQQSLLVRDSSIKYLDILEDDSSTDIHNHQQQSQPQSQRNKYGKKHTQGLGLGLFRGDQWRESHGIAVRKGQGNMRRLKILSQFRKVVQH